MIHGYGKVLQMGNKYIGDILDGEVVVQEKVDGSQFSFDMLDSLLHLRSRNKAVYPGGPDKMFAQAVVEVQKRAHMLVPGWVYRGEYLQRPKHNALSYERVPHGHIILFDIETAPGEYLPWDLLGLEADRIELECVPTYHAGTVAGVEQLLPYLERKPILGGKMIEGVVVKNYAHYTPEGTAYKAKIVAADFRELHKESWRKDNPNKDDVIGGLIGRYSTERRWEKAVEHLRDEGLLQEAPQDIGPLMKAVSQDVHEEEVEAIKEALFRWAWPKISRGITGGLPEWYKRRLLGVEQEVAL